MLANMWRKGRLAGMQPGTATLEFGLQFSIEVFHLFSHSFMFSFKFLNKFILAI